MHAGMVGVEAPTSEGLLLDPKCSRQGDPVHFAPIDPTVLHGRDRPMGPLNPKSLSWCLTQDKSFRKYTRKKNEQMSPLNFSLPCVSILYPPTPSLLAVPVAVLEVTRGPQGVPWGAAGSTAAGRTSCDSGIQHC